MTDLVIDASITQAAGTTNAPTSTNCRQFLEAVLYTGTLRCLLSPELREEWGRHTSLYSVRWRTAMYSRRRIRPIPSPHNNALRRNLIRCARTIAGNDRTRTPAIQSAMEKDTHLLEAAIEENGAVASLDDKVRNHFAVCARDNHSLRQIPWVNPTNPEEDAINWVLAGASSEPSRTLGQAAGTG